jgi:hypothetical protein
MNLEHMLRRGLIAIALVAPAGLAPVCLHNAQEKNIYEHGVTG